MILKNISIILLMISVVSLLILNSKLMKKKQIRISVILDSNGRYVGVISPIHIDVNTCSMNVDTCTMDEDFPVEELDKIINRIKEENPDAVE